MVEQFQRFFNLSLEEREKTLEKAVLTRQEKAEIQRTLDQFARLDPTQRAVCLRSFARFTNLSEWDQAQFLKNASRWQSMTPEERRSWRRFLAEVTTLTPPGSEVPPLPPRPRANEPSPLP